MLFDFPACVAQYGHRFISSRAMSRDEARYPEAENFIPDRFLNAEGMLTDDDPAKYVFGFGRRICPCGVHGTLLYIDNMCSRTSVYLVSRPACCRRVDLERHCDDVGHARLQSSERCEWKGHDLHGDFCKWIWAVSHLEDSSCSRPSY
jgi:Cytochrome P450